MSQLRSLALSRLRVSMRDALGDCADEPGPLAGRDRRAADGGVRHGQQPPASRATRATAVIGYNFRRPDRVTKEQIHSLHFLHDRFARNVSTSMSAYMRVVTDVGILSVEQFSYSEFLMSLSDPTAFYAMSMPPFEGTARSRSTPRSPSR